MKLDRASSSHQSRVAPPLLLLAIVACGGAPHTITSPQPLAPRAIPHSVIPAPATAMIASTDSFTVDTATSVVVDAGASEETARIGQYLVDLLAVRTLREVRRLSPDSNAGALSIHLRLEPQRAALGAEGYELTITRDRVSLIAREPAGLFHGVQTIRQLLPTVVEYRAAQPRRLRMPAGQVIDAPRYAWRGAMLDVSRHFLPAEDVKRFIDILAYYKMNRLHLHLSDDQGWRIEIRSRPNLTLYGASTQVGGGTGGFYTQETYADLVAYAEARYVTIVPEIDMPGHTNAALASYAELNCSGISPPLYTGTSVGFSTLCVGDERTYQFVDDVVREIAALTPGPWFHIGGDEVSKLTPVEYRDFIERVQTIVTRYGKHVVGWGDIAPANLLRTAIVQQWSAESVAPHVARGGSVVVSTAKRAYLDMKYDATTLLGLRWAGLVEVRDAYDWNPAIVAGVPDSAVLGVEAPLWSETLEKRADFEFMALPRLAAVAEVAWSPVTARGWEAFRERLGTHGPRLAALGVNFYRSPQIPWRP
jgi:hexosaminidase